MQPDRDAVRLGPARERLTKFPVCCATRAGFALGASDLRQAVIAFDCSNTRTRRWELIEVSTDVQPRVVEVVDHVERTEAPAADHSAHGQPGRACAAHRCRFRTSAGSIFDDTGDGRDRLGVVHHSLGRWCVPRCARKPDARPGPTQRTCVRSNHAGRGLTPHWPTHRCDCRYLGEATQTKTPETPEALQGHRFSSRWWAVQGSNLRHLPCEGSALPLS